MLIGKLARLTGATPKAIRLYEALQLIPVPQRRGKYRVYTELHIVLVHMIRRGQSAGFSLAEQKELLHARARSGTFPLELAEMLIAAKQRELGAQRVQLELSLRDLQDLQDEVRRNYGAVTVR